MPAPAPAPGPGPELLAWVVPWPWTAPSLPARSRLSAAMTALTLLSKEGALQEARALQEEEYTEEPFSEKEKEEETKEESPA